MLCDLTDYYTSCFWSDLCWSTTPGEGSNCLKCPLFEHNLSDCGFVESKLFRDGFIPFSRLMTTTTLFLRFSEIWNQKSELKLLNSVELQVFKWISCPLALATLPLVSRVSAVQNNIKTVLRPAHIKCIPYVHTEQEYLLTPSHKHSSTWVSIFVASPVIHICSVSSVFWLCNNVLKNLSWAYRVLLFRKSGLRTCALYHTLVYA